jgi:hypothetical protein
VAPAHAQSPCHHASCWPTAAQRPIRQVHAQPGATAAAAAVKLPGLQQQPALQRATLLSQRAALQQLPLTAAGCTETAQRCCAYVLGCSRAGSACARIHGCCSTSDSRMRDATSLTSSCRTKHSSSSSSDSLLTQTAGGVRSPGDGTHHVQALLGTCRNQALLCKCRQLGPTQKIETHAAWLHPEHGWTCERCTPIIVHKRQLRHLTRLMKSLAPSLTAGLSGNLRSTRTMRRYVWQYKQHMQTAQAVQRHTRR